MSKFRVIGIADNSMMLRYLQPSDFSNDKYDGVRLYQRWDKKPVVLFHSKGNAPEHWQVIDGMMDFYFRSYEEAIRFCKSRRYTLLKEEKA